MRTLILAGLAYLGYRAVKSLMLQGAASRKTVDKQATGQIDDVMIKDPFCNVYFERNEGRFTAIHLEGDARLIYRGELLADAWMY